MEFQLKNLILIALLALVAGCEKPDPHPELKDAEYVLYLEDERTAAAIVKEAEAGLLSAQNDAKTVTPQTGQIKFAEKRLWEAANRLSKAKQNEQLAKMRLQVRKAQIQEIYLHSFYEKKELTSESKEAILQRRNLASQGRDWSVEKRRAALGLQTKSNKGPQPEAAPEKKTVGGGH